MWMFFLATAFGCAGISAVGFIDAGSGRPDYGSWRWRWRYRNARTQGWLFLLFTWAAALTSILVR